MVLAAPTLPVSGTATMVLQTPAAAPSFATESGPSVEVASDGPALLSPTPTEVTPPAPPAPAAPAAPAGGSLLRAVLAVAGLVAAILVAQLVLAVSGLERALPNLALLFLFWLYWLEVRLIAGRQVIAAGRFVLMFVVGLAGVATSVLILERVWATFIGANAMTYTAGPVIEEILKVLPVLLVAWVLRDGRRLTIGDLAMIGFSIGIGYGYFEAGLRASADGVLPAYVTSATALLPGVRLTQDAGGAVVSIGSGHGAMTGLVGLAIGVGIRLWPRGWLGWLPAVPALALVIFDHAILNWKLISPHGYGQLQAVAPLIDGLYWVTLLGALPLVLFVIGLVLASFWQRRQDTAALQARPELLLAGERPRSSVANEWAIALAALRRGPAEARRLFGYFRHRRALAVAAAEQLPFDEEMVYDERADLDSVPAPRTSPLTLVRRYAVAAVFIGLFVALFMVGPKRLPTSVQNVVNAPWFLVALVAVAGLYVVFRLGRMTARPRPAAEDLDARINYDFGLIVIGSAAVALAGAVVVFLWPPDQTVPAHHPDNGQSALKNFGKKGGHLQHHQAPAAGAGAGAHHHQGGGSKGSGKGDHDDDDEEQKGGKAGGHHAPAGHAPAGHVAPAGGHGGAPPAGGHGAAPAGGHGAPAAGGHGAPAAGGHGAPPAGGHGAPPAGGHGAPPAGGHGAPPAGGHGAPPAGGHGAPPAGGHGAPPAGGHGAPPAGGHGAPPGGHGAPPAGGHGAPPAGGHGAPPAGGHGAPPAGGHGAPPGGHGAPPAGGHGAPPGGHGAPPGGHGAPPAGGHGAPPAGGHGAPPAGGHGAPPAGGHGAPPAGGHGAPPAGGHGAPPAGGHGAPPAGGHGAPPAGGHGAPPAGQGTPQHPTGPPVPPAAPPHVDGGGVHPGGGDVVGPPAGHAGPQGPTGPPAPGTPPAGGGVHPGAGEVVAPPAAHPAPPPAAPTGPHSDGSEVAGHQPAAGPADQVTGPPGHHTPAAPDPKDKPDPPPAKPTPPPPKP